MWRHSSRTEPLGPLSIHVIAPEKLGRGLAVSSRAPIGPGYLRRRPTCTDNPNLRGLGSIVLGDFPGGGRTWIHVVVSTWTDNSGNGSALNKLKSTRCPSSVVMMELSCFLKRMSAKAMVAAHGELRGGRTGEWRRTDRTLGSIRRDGFQSIWVRSTGKCGLPPSTWEDGGRHDSVKARGRSSVWRTQTETVQAGRDDPDDRSVVRAHLVVHGLPP